MRRKSLFTAIAALLTMTMLCGCTIDLSKLGNAFGDVEITNGDDDEDDDDNDDTDVDADDEDDGDGDDISVTASDEEYYLYSSNDDLVNVIDADGNLKYSYYLSGATMDNDKVIAATGMPADIYGDYYEFVAADGYDAYCTFSYWDDAGYSGVYVYNAEDDSVKLIDKYSDKSNLTSVDLYDGKVYVRKETYDSEKGVYFPQELIYEKDSSGRYIRIPNPLDSFIGTVEGSVLTPKTNNNMNYCSKKSLTRMLDECGYFVVQKGLDLYVVSESSETKIPNDSSVYMNFEGMSKDCVLYSTYEESAWLYKYDIATGHVTAIDNATTTLGTFGDSFYYSKNSNFDGYFDATYTCDVYKYDFTTETAQKLYSEDSCPELGAYRAAVSGFTVVGDTYYYLGAEKKDIDWFKFDGSKKTDTGMKVSHIDFADYGYIEVFEHTEFCEKCGKPISYYYAERFYFYDDAIANAADLNEIFGEIYSDEAYNYFEYGLDVLYDDCEYHSYSTNYINNRVTSVRGLGTNHIVYNKCYNEYFGGAHDYSSYSQYIFDKDTGSAWTFSETYEGTEAEYINLVVEKTIADYNSYDYVSSPYFAESASELEKEVRSYVSLSSHHLWFDNDCAYIMYYPYEMGPYASGFIMIPVTYEELFGRGFSF